MTKIKICGLMTVADANLVNQAGVDYAGAVFAEGRHRVDEVTARLIRQELSDNIPLVGVFTDSPVEEIIALYQKDIIQIAQLHGPRQPEEIQQLKRAAVPLIGVALGQKLDEQLGAYAGVDYLMVDSGKGSGRTLDWQTLPKNKMTEKLFLAGGLTVFNLKEAIAEVQPFAVDISSGSESSGQKDLEKIEKLVAIAHQKGE
ncbi:phosphoribosylanthranilate isomerase [Fructobacillus durionis]|uniref:N-(5'-phosphoribosyl)anthranilate isomerase n=1 Tax=Fructobacillus durionis TaxID=283737 RepID=A0A1I1FP78_9LACO|nr:phosphoribosylanthranilate isomerase [Fructobacillus durionis]SFC01124.1 phosphoribosylanthranilate isomerase [Fructobacillus durionis]